MESTEERNNLRKMLHPFLLNTRPWLSASALRKKGVSEHQASCQVTTRALEAHGQFLIRFLSLMDINLYDSSPVTECLSY